MTNLNDNAWRILFDRHKIKDKIEQDGFFEISAKQINQEREARLMTKFDNKSQLPKLFSSHSLSILPVTRGNYVIAPFEAYQKFDDKNLFKNEDINYITFPEHIQSIAPDNITSESMAINCAYASGILQDFIDDELLLPTLSGRMSSNEFRFKINNIVTRKAVNVSVQNSQIEIDAGYEGVETFSIIEAKNNIADDFLIRQLYYPFRRVNNILSKTVKTMFMVYTNSVFNLYEYIFDDPNNYNSLRLNKFKRYSFDKIEISLQDIHELMQSIKFVPEDVKIPFPQANSFERVINLCELLRTENMSETDIAMKYDFAGRQSGYYFNAGKYLGLFNKLNSEIYLTPLALEIMKCQSRKRTLGFIKLILQHKLFYDAVSIHLKNGVLTSSDIINVLNENAILYADETIKRRSSTVQSWIDWIFSQVNQDN